MQISIRREYNYSDVYLLPKKTIVNSRSECNTSVVFGGRRFAAPVVASNMRTVVSEKTCEYLAKNDFFYIYHRFDIDVVKFIHNMKSKGYYSSISMGVNEDSYAQLKEIKEAKLDIDYCCLDVANGFCIKSERFIKYFKDNFPTSYLIAGNVCTQEGVTFLENIGADSVKVGLSNGSVCDTFKATGVGRPQLSTDLECCLVATKPIISDGGASTVGCIVKSLVAGSTMKMIGSMAAGWEESAGEILDIDGHLKKVYYGSASKENKNGKHIHVEGRQTYLDYKGSMDILLYDIKAGISSAISYAGGKDLSALLTMEMVSR
jgi:GMP reductase